MSIVYGQYPNFIARGLSKTPADILEGVITNNS